MSKRYDVAVIGAGPAGSTAAALMCQRGFDVVVLERDHFPRFSIGESLLPQCMAFLEEAGFLDALQQAGFQRKDGACFRWGERTYSFDFADKVTPGWATTYQVQRARFDTILANEAIRMGAKVQYGCQIQSVDLNDNHCRITTLNDDNRLETVHARFCLDASGFGRVLPRLLDLGIPSSLPPRAALFTHVTDPISQADFDRNKILITIHPTIRDVWYWLIPFSDGSGSLGVVGDPDRVLANGVTLAALQAFVADDPYLSGLLAGAEYTSPVQSLKGYSASVRTLHGPGFALLGNAAEFLDPIFSSGVTIALYSASLAAGTLALQLEGKTVDWETDYACRLRVGTETFRAFVNAWYEGPLQDIIFFPSPRRRLVRLICSVLAGYAWDETNPFVTQPQRHLSTLGAACAPT